MTTVFVTHDQEEAFELADRVVVMIGGRIDQIGTPDDILKRPATPAVARFIGTGHPADQLSTVPCSAGAL